MIITVSMLSAIIFLIIYFWWGFRVLPGERWQIVASVPASKMEQGDWKGINFRHTA